MLDTIIAIAQGIGFAVLLLLFAIVFLGVNWMTVLLAGEVKRK